MTKARDGRQPKPLGRKSKLTRDVHDAIIKSLIFGASNFAAANAAGIDERSFYRWIERGEAAEEVEDDGQSVRTSEIVFLQFCQDVRRARGHAVSSAEQRLFFEDPGTWLMRGPQARTRHDRDGWSQQVAVIAPTDGPDRVDTGLSLGEDFIEEVIAAFVVEVEAGRFRLPKRVKTST